MFEKIEVNGPNTHPVYNYLRRHSELYDRKTGLTKELPWSWSKFLCTGNGKVVKFYKPSMYPLEFKSDIEQLLLRGDRF